MLENAERFLTVMVLLNFALVIIHGAAHAGTQIFPSFLDDVFIALVIVLDPLVGLVLFLKGSPRIGGLVLLISFAASLIYGVYNHFVITGSDNALRLPQGGWSALFLVTALLLPVTEIVGLVSALLLTV